MDKKILTYALLIALLTTGAYLNSLNSPFHFDDYHSILYNPHIRDIGNIPDILTNPQMFSGDRYAAMYRPLLLITYALNYKIGGYNPLGYHIVNILIHTLNTLLIYFILLFLLTNFQFQISNFQFFPAFLASLIFGVHTLNTQAVNYISSRSVLLVTLFYLLSFYLYIRFLRFTDHGSRITLYLLSLISFALSLLSKEIAITLPLILLLYDYLFHKPSNFKFQISNFKFPMRYLPYWAITAGYLLLRKFLMGRATMNLSLKAFTEGTPDTRGIFVNILTQVKANLFYIKSVSLPTRLSVEHYMKEAKGIDEPAILLSLTIIFLLVASAFILRKKYWGMSLGILWFYITIMPETLIPLKLIINEHRIYLPMVGFAIFCGFFLHLRLLRPELDSGLAMTGEESTTPRNDAIKCHCERPNTQSVECSGAWQSRLTSYSLLLVLLLFIFLNTIGTINRNEIWQDEYTLWKDAIEKYPGRLFRAHFMIGILYERQGLLTDAMKEYETSAQINPRYIDAHNNLGVIYRRLRMPDKAIKEFEIAIKLKSFIPDFHNNLGTVYSDLGMFEKAIEAYKTAIKLNPSFPEAHNNLGAAYHNLGRLNEAIEEYKIALSLRPDYKKALWNLNRANAEMSAGNRSGK